MNSAIFFMFTDALDIPPDDQVLEAIRNDSRARRLFCGRCARKVPKLVVDDCVGTDNLRSGDSVHARKDIAGRPKDI